MAFVFNRSTFERKIMDRKKKICFVSDGHQLYDDRMYWKQALSLKKNGYDVSMVVADREDESGVTEHGIPFRKVKRTKFSEISLLNRFIKLFYYPTHRAMAKYAIDFEADLYHVPDSRPNRFIQKLKNSPHRPKLLYDAREPIDNNLKLFVKAKGFKKKLLHFYADYMQKVEYKKVELYDAVITVDDGLKRRFLENSKAKKVEVVYNYTNLKDKRKNLPFSEREFDAIYCGAISEERGFYPILKSTKQIIKKFPEYKVLLLGNIFDPKLKDYLSEFISENHLQKNIIWMNHLRFDKVSDYYNQSKIGLNILYPSDAFREIIQIKLFEYMNFGMPIVTSNFGEMQNYVLNNHTGLSVNPFDEKELAEAIMNLLSQPEKMEELGRNGIHAVDEKFNWDEMERKLLLIYDSLLTDHGES